MVYGPISDAEEVTGRKLLPAPVQGSRQAGHLTSTSASDEPWAAGGTHGC